VAGPVLLAIAVLLGVGATMLAWSQVRRAAAPGSSSAPITMGGSPVPPAALARALKRLPPEERVGELARRAAPGSWEHQLAVEALAAPGKAAQVATVNLALAEMEHTLTAGAAWPRSSVRIALLGTGLLAAAAYIVDREQIRWWLSIVALGGVAALACFEAGRRAEHHATQRRRAVDDLVAAAFGDGAAGGGDIAPRRARRRRPGFSAARDPR
jgi:hypothetical protein